jgi:hypothetical protein
MKLRIRIIDEEDVRSWETYLCVLKPDGVPFGRAVLEVDYEKEWVPCWELIEVTHD